MVVYALVLRGFQAALGAGSEYVEGFIRPAIFLAQPLSVAASIIEEAAALYSGSESIFGASLGAVGLMMVLGIFAMEHCVDGWMRGLTISILLLRCLAAPFAFNVVVGGGGKVPYRAT